MRYLVVLTICIGFVSAQDVGKAWINLGYATVSQWYDSTGEAQDMKDVWGADLSALNLRLGGKYNLTPTSPTGIYIGANLGLSQYTYSPDTGDSYGSGFTLQYLFPFLMVGTSSLSGLVGYQLDIGPEYSVDSVTGDITTMPNTDGQNAFVVGVWAHMNTPTYGLFGGVSYILTMEGTDHFGLEGFSDTTTYDLGDLIILKGGGSYNFGTGDAGLALVYRMRTKQKVSGTEVENSDGYNLSVYPFVNLLFPGSPMKLSLKLAADDEYYYYGFSFAGKNDFVTRLAFTLGASYSF